jgi:SulP family sulfate permease
MLLPRDLNTVRGDIYGGLTAAVVALPLALAFGVASGVGAIAGLYGAIAVGFFAAIFGGTNSQVSGPTGPMTVVMAVIVTDHADHLGEAFAIVFLAGAIQVLFGTLRIGRFISYTPYSVVSGFMSGIGVIIIMIQVLPFFGLATVPGGPLGALQAWAQAIQQLNPQALAIGCLSLGIAIFWPARLRALLPSPLAALIFGTLAAIFRAARSAGDWFCANRASRFTFAGHRPRPAAQDRPAGSDPRPDGVDRQSADVAGRRFSHPYAP